MSPHDGSSRERSAGRSDQGTADGVLVRSGNRQALSIGTALDLLTDEYRRRMLEVLRNRPSRTARLETIVEEIATRERRGKSSGPDRGVRRSVDVQLRHQHLPKLDRAGVIDFDEADETLTYRGDPVLDVYLDVTEEIEG